MDTITVEKMTYDWSAKKRLKFINSCTDSETLHCCAFNYNWSDGFAEPAAYINNPVCSLSTALQIFFDADGVRYLENKGFEPEDWQEEWWDLLKKLYKRIIAHDFIITPIKFEPPITHVERYNMEKDLKDEESVFYTSIEGVDCNIYV